MLTGTRQILALEEDHRHIQSFPFDSLLSGTLPNRFSSILGFLKLSISSQLKIPQACQTRGMLSTGCEFDMPALVCTVLEFPLLVPWPENFQGSKLSNHLFPIFWDYSALLCAVDCLMWILVFSGRKYILSLKLGIS